MKLTTTFFVLGLFCTVINAQHTDTLTNEQIIKLSKAGFSNEVLKSKIQMSPAKFDASLDGMLALKKAGVSEEVINLIVTNPNGVANNSNNPKNQIADSKEVNSETGIQDLPSGIYYKNPKGEYVEIEPSILTGTKTNQAAQILISALINSRTKASLSGKQSSSVIYETSPKFYFIFDTTYTSNLNSENNVWFGSTRSPKEFLLIKLEEDRNSRDITVSKGNIANSNSGINEKSIVQFQSKKISKGIYEVTPESPFSKGEYCFMFAQGIKQGETSKVFDISIRPMKAF